MRPDLLASLQGLSDVELEARVHDLVARERDASVLLVAHLAELDTREVHFRAGHGSLFAYCRDALGLSEQEAYNRIAVARSVRRFPGILEMLEGGSVSLTTVRLLGPHLTPDNHTRVLDSARGKTRTQVEEIAAALWPRPDAPSFVRKLPRVKGLAAAWIDSSQSAHPPRPGPPSMASSPGTSASRSVASWPPDPAGSDSPASPSTALDLCLGAPPSTLSAPPSAVSASPSAQSAPLSAPSAPLSSPAAPPSLSAPASFSAARPPSCFAAPASYCAPSAAPLAAPPNAPSVDDAALPHALSPQDAVNPTASGAVSPLAPTRRSAEVTPLSPDRYRVQVTIGGDTLEKLRLAKDLLRHAVPSGDEAVILDRALTALLEDLAQKRFAAAELPRASSGGAPGSRHIPAEVRRTVWTRDHGCCAFVGRSGRRCSDRAFLEFHHIQPFALGGESTVANIQLRCRSHNAYEARMYFTHGNGHDGAGSVREANGCYGPAVHETHSIQAGRPATRFRTSRGSRKSQGPAP